MGTKTQTSKQAARILIVEDDAAIRESLAEGLGLDGYRVTTAEDVSAAKRRLRRSEFDLLLLDVNLPAQSGYELLRDLRAGHLGESGKRKLSVLMLSGRAAEVDRFRGFELGCD